MADSSAQRKASAASAHARKLRRNVLEHIGSDQAGLAQTIEFLRREPTQGQATIGKIRLGEALNASVGQHAVESMSIDMELLFGGAWRELRLAPLAADMQAVRYLVQILQGRSPRPEWAHPNWPHVDVSKVAP